MFDLYLKTIRQELESRNLVELHPLKVGEYKTFLRNTVKQLIERGQGAEKYLSRVLDNIFRDVDLLVRLRIVKTALGASIAGESVDSELLRYVEKIVEFSAKYLAGVLVEREGHIAVKFLKNCSVDGRKYKRGDVTSLTMSNALIMFLKGCVDPVPEVFMYTLHTARSE